MRYGSNLARSLRRRRPLLGGGAFLILILASCGADDSKPSGRHADAGLVYPRVLLLTTGSDGTGTLPAGANLALETFNALGAFAEIADKSVLLARARLDSTRIIVAPTIAGYHDADRLFSLSFLDSASMANLARWVEAGGILIAGENVGRNTPEGMDRAADDGVLSAREWPLAPVFGYAMREVDLSGCQLVKDSGATLLEGYRSDLSRLLANDWLLVPVESVGVGVRTLAWWRGDTARYPGLTVNRFGQGYGIMVPYFLLLQPANDGGAGDIAAIAGFYRRVFALALGDGPEVCVNPWPGPYRGALAVTLNEAGDGGDGLERLLTGLFAVPGLNAADVFVTGRLPGPMLDYLRRESRVRLASLGYTHARFRDLDYCRTVWELARLEDFLRLPLAGFRFPFSNRTPAGVFSLAQRGYRYESSIPIDHAAGFSGTLFPYRLPVWVREQYCLMTSVLELSPALEDWDFYGDGVASGAYDPAAQTRDATRLAARLQSTWRDLVLPRQGMMILTLHGAYSGFSATTLAPVTGFLTETVKAGDVWLTSLEGIADWWQARGRVDIRVQASPDRTVLRFTNRNPTPVTGLTLRLKPNQKATARGVTLRVVRRSEADGEFTYHTFDLAETGEVEVTK